MIEFEILMRGRYQPMQLVVEYNPLLHMSITPGMQMLMDELWRQKMIVAQEKGFLLFDGSLFRLMQAESRADEMLHIVVGDTSYKEYIVTRVPEFAQALARQELSNPLSVCSVIETSDGCILIEKRQGTDVYNGRYHVIGGFMERGLDIIEHLPDPFGAIKREIREETGIQISDIRGQYCLGVVYDTVMPHPELCFVTLLTIPLSEVLTREPEDNEVKQLLSLNVTAESLKEFISSNHGNISATGEANLIMYGGWKFGEAWFEDVMRSVENTIS